MRKNWMPLVFLFLLFIILGGQESEKEISNPMTYPITPRVDQEDDYFGTKVSDPYRWLEEDNNENVKKWIEEQNDCTFSYLEKIPYRDRIRRRLAEIYNYPRCQLPQRAGPYYFFSKNNGLQNQSVIYFQKGLTGNAEIFFDPNRLSDDGTVAVNLLDFSSNNHYVALGFSEAGSDWQEIRVMEISSKRQLSDRIRWVKFSGAAWYENGFYYSGYTPPRPGQELSAKNEFEKVFYHLLGTPQSRDTVVYQDKLHPLRYHRVQVTEDNKYLLIQASEGTHGHEYLYRELDKKGSPLIPLFLGFNANFDIIDTFGRLLLVRTNADAPNYKVVLVNPKNPAPEKWITTIPEKPEVLQKVNSAGGKLFVSYLKDASIRIFQFDRTGKLEKEIALPTLGTASGFKGKKEEKIVFYTFSSFTYPETIYKYDINLGLSEIYWNPEITFNPFDYETSQVFYSSQDGTLIPMFLVMKKNLPRDGSHPVYLYGYGGFNSSLLPQFNPSRLVLLENGCILALPNLRGGGEYGETWHRQGMLEKKQNVFDDFIAGAEYLIKKGYTSPRKLAIAGDSNGGLLVGACLTQRPDLFRVALPGVGVMDMLRFHKFTVGWGWVVEYGSADNPDQFRTLYAYSPLHHIKDNTCYPATLAFTADHDDRVIPSHSFKFIAALQEKQACQNPVLIRIGARAGHGRGKPISKLLDENADRFAFMFFNMGISVNER